MFAARQKSFLQPRGFTHHFFSAKNNGGFTLLELTVVVSIMVLMLTLLFANYREINDQGKVLGAGEKLKSNLQLTQNYALAGRANGVNRANGWGVYLDRAYNKYVVFSDINSSKTYDYPTKLLIHGTEWTSGATFDDSAQAANRVTVSGATQDASAGKPEGTTGYWTFGGDGDYLQVPASSNFDFGSDNFAIDLWIYSTVADSEQAIMYKGDGASSLVFSLKKESNNRLKFTIYSQAGGAYSVWSNAGKQAIATNTWYHVAITKENTFLRLFVNGSAHQSRKMNAAVRSQSNNILIGITDATVYPWNGRLDEIRISKGVSRWREKFSVPTAAYVADDEIFKEIKLPPGIVFERLYQGASGASSLNVFYHPTMYLMYLNNNGATQAATIRLNNAGTEGTAGAGDTPRIYKVYSSGLIENQN